MTIRGTRQPIGGSFCPDGYWHRLQKESRLRLTLWSPQIFLLKSATIGSWRVMNSAETRVLDEKMAWRTLLLSGLAVFATFLDTSILFVAFPDIVRSFPSAESTQLSWVINAYTIAFAALVVPSGKIADRVGHKRSFLSGSLLFTSASLLCAAAQSPFVLILFRVMQGVGAAVLIPSSLALVIRAFPREKLPVAVAIWGGIGGVAGALGPSLGAVLVDAANWRWVFLVNLPVGLITIWGGRIILRESRDETMKIPSLSGVVLFAGSAAMLSLGVVQSEDWGWAENRTLTSLIVGGVLLTVFWFHQRRSERPALDLDLFGIRNVAWANLAMFVYGGAFAAMFFGSVLFLTDVWGWSITAAGFGVAPGPSLVALLAPRAGKLAAVVGQRPLLVAGGLLFAASGLLRVVMLGAEPNYLVDYLPSMLLTALGVALLIPQLSSTIAQALPQNRVGVGSGLNQAVRQFGATFGVALTVAFLSGEIVDAAEVIARFDRIWWLIVVGGLLSAAASLPLQTGSAGAKSAEQS